MRSLIIVGAGSGLGKVIAQKLYERNLNVFIVGRTNPNNSRKNNFYEVDIINVDWKKLLKKITDENKIQITDVIFNAGTGAFGITNLIPIKDAKFVFDLNFWCCSEAAIVFAEYWKQAKIEGCFLAVSSISALRATPLESYYAASKAALSRFLECLALEYKPFGIKLNSVYPGLLATKFRTNGKWFGVKPDFKEIGENVANTAEKIISILDGKRKVKVLGWKERTITLIDRISPKLYNNLVLDKRIMRYVFKNSESEND